LLSRITVRAQRAGGLAGTLVVVALMWAICRHRSPEDVASDVMATAKGRYPSIGEIQNQHRPEIGCRSGSPVRSATLVDKTRAAPCW